jgi:hypothetical protein
MENLKERRIAAIVSYSRLIQKKELKTINSFKTHKSELFDPRRRIENEKQQYFSSSY